MGLLKGHGITNFELRIATSYPLYALLRNVDIHITEFSSTVVEASQCGVPTVIINKIGAKLFQNEVNSGGVVTAYKPIEVVSAIQTLLRSENIRPRKKENSYGLEYKVFDYIMQIIDQNKIKKTVFPH